mgnify:CR=1 FL=1
MVSIWEEVQRSQEMKLNSLNLLNNQDVGFTWTQDSYFSELKETEIMKERLDLLSQMEDYIGRYYSTEWIKKNILRQSEREMEEMQLQIDNEKQSGEIQSEDEMADTGEEY